MKKASMAISGIVVLAIVIIWSTYSGIISKDEAVVESWGNVEATYQRRADLIPSLVKIVKSYAKHEKETFQAVTEARASIGKIQISEKMLSNPEMLNKFQAAQGELSSVLSRLMAVAEAYPDLKANEQYLKLQDQLEGTENRINVARQRYNKAVRMFNVSIRQPVGAFVNNTFLHLEKKFPFKAKKGADIAPVIDM